MSNIRIVIGLIVVAFLGGSWVVIGYGNPRKREGRLHQLLVKVGDAADRIENRNRDLVSQVEVLKGNAVEAEAMKAESQVLRGQLDNSAWEMNRLTVSMDGLRARASEAEKLTEERRQLKARNAELKGRIAGLDNEFLNLKGQLTKKQQEIAEKETMHVQLQTELSAAREEALQGEKFKALTDKLQARISTLEKENLDLRTVIDNISEITKEKTCLGKRTTGHVTSAPARTMKLRCG